MVWASEMSPPPPRPCKARAPASAVMLGASAQATEPSDEDRDADQQHDAPPVDIGEFAVERRHHRGGDEIGGDDPGQILRIAEIRRRWSAGR